MNMSDVFFFYHVQIVAERQSSQMTGVKINKSINGIITSTIQTVKVT